jgi:class 3 adenylate cyclase
MRVRFSRFANAHRPGQPADRSRSRAGSRVQEPAGRGRVPAGRVQVPTGRGQVPTVSVDYTVLGSAVNIASRLESGVAKPGQLVVSQNTLERVIGSFETEPLGEFALKGLQQKMPVYRITESVSQPGPPRDVYQATTTR